MTITYEAKEVPLSRVRPFAEQPREYFDPVEIAARAESMRLAGQQAPCIVERISGDPDHDYELIDGESRWRSAKLAGLPLLLVIIRSEPFRSTVEKHRASLIANFNRSEHTPMEISDALQLQMSSTPGLTQQHLADMIGKEQMWVSHYLSLQGLHPSIQKLLHPTASRSQRLATSTAFCLARAPIDRQLEIMEAARREDGKVLMSKVIQILDTRPGAKKRERRDGKKKASIALGNALRAVGSGFAKIRLASPADAQEIFRKLKSAGEIPEIGCVEDLLKLIKAVNPETDELLRRFPDMPVLPSGASKVDKTAHAEVLRDFWLSKADPRKPDAPLLSIAYPKRLNLPPFVPTKWHKNLP